jgi:hypothetical protein
VAFHSNTKTARTKATTPAKSFHGHHFSFCFG